MLQNLTNVSLSSLHSQVWTKTLSLLWVQASVAANFNPICTNSSLAKCCPGINIFPQNPKSNLSSCPISRLILFKQLCYRLRPCSKFYIFIYLSPTASFAQSGCFSLKYRRRSSFSSTNRVSVNFLFSQTQSAVCYSVLDRTHYFPV